MTEKMMSGYANYTTADEFGGGTVGQAPATLGLSIAVSVTITTYETYTHDC